MEQCNSTVEVTIEYTSYLASAVDMEKEKVDCIDAHVMMTLLCVPLL